MSREAERARTELRMVQREAAAKRSAADHARARAEQTKREWDAAATGARERRAVARELAVQAAERARVAAEEAEAARVQELLRAAPPPLAMPACTGASLAAMTDALSSSTRAMEDFLLRAARRSPAASHALQLLRSLQPSPG